MKNKHYSVIRGGLMGLAVGIISGGIFGLVLGGTYLYDARWMPGGRGC